MTQEELNKLTPEEKRIRIAEIVRPRLMYSSHSWRDRDDRRYFKCANCGDEQTWLEFCKAGKHPEGKCAGEDSDFLNDKNAMAEALKLIPQDKQNDFVEEILFKNENAAYSIDSSAWFVLNATAEELADAFLLTLG